MCIHNEDKEVENCVDVVILKNLFSVKFPEVVILVLTKSASCWGVQRVTDFAKFQVQITKDEAQMPLLFCSHDYCSRFPLSLSPSFLFFNLIYLFIS